MSVLAFTFSRTCIHVYMCAYGYIFVKYTSDFIFAYTKFYLLFAVEGYHALIWQCFLFFTLGLIPVYMYMMKSMNRKSP